MAKSIIKRLKYINQTLISMNRPDDVEPDCYLNIFTDGKILYGWKEYDYFKNRTNLKSNNWKLGCYYFMKFVPKEEEKHLGNDTTIIQRLKEAHV